MDGRKPNPGEHKFKEHRFTVRYLRDQVTPPRFLSLGFLGMIFLGSILLRLPLCWNPGAAVSYLDALFTATSAVCVNGLIVVDTADTFNIFGQIVVMLLIQLGGFGFMTAAVVTALLFGKKRITLWDRKVIQEVLGPSAVQDVSQVIWRIIRLTLAIELSGALLLALGWLGQFGPRAFYLGLFYSVSAFNNAGFDLMGQFRSLTSFSGDTFILSVIMLLVFLGGLGFAVIWEILKYPRNHRLSVNTKIILVTTFVLLAVGFLGVLLLETGNPATLGAMSTKDRIVNAMFFSVTPRSGGFSTVRVGAMSQAGMFLMVLLMTIGASPGSTGGGIKTTTFATVLSARLADVRRKRYPVMFRRRIDIETVARADTILVLYIILIIVSSMILTISESTQFIDALFEAVSATATVGLTTGITPDLTIIGKLTIMVTMYVGRVGPLTLAFAVAKGGRQLYDYPREEITLS